MFAEGENDTEQLSQGRLKRGPIIQIPMLHFAKHQIWKLWWGYCSPKVCHAQSKSSSNRQTIPPSSNKSHTYTYTHTHTKTNNTYSRWLESREDNKEREKRVPSLEDCCSAGLEPPHPTHLGVVIHTSQHRNAPQCCKSLPTLACWCSNSHPPASPTSKVDKPPTPRLEARGARSSIQPKTITIHARNTNLLRTKQDKSLVQQMSSSCDQIQRFALNNALLLHPPAQIPAILTTT